MTVEMKTSQVFSSAWHVPRDGFVWIEAPILYKSQEGGPAIDRVPIPLGRREPPVKAVKKLLVWNHSSDDGWHVPREYDPITECPALFRDFARLEATEDAILSFANRYGALGLSTLIDRSSEQGSGHSHGELFDDWKLRIGVMRETLRVWDLVNAKKSDELLSYVYIVKEPRLRLFDCLRPLFEDLPDSVSALDIPRSREWKNGEDILTVAWNSVCDEINRRMDGATSSGPVEDKASGKLKPRHTHNSLDGAMWLQFALSIDGNKDQRACKECGKYFEMSAHEDGRSVRREFCTDSCKFRDYNRRKKQAAEMKAAGESIRAISKKTNTSEDTIKRWLAKKK